MSACVKILIPGDKWFQSRLCSDIQMCNTMKGGHVGGMNDTSLEKESGIDREVFQSREAIERVEDHMESSPSAVSSIYGEVEQVRTAAEDHHSYPKGNRHADVQVMDCLWPCGKWLQGTLCAFFGCDTDFFVKRWLHPAPMNINFIRWQLGALPCFHRRRNSHVRGQFTQFSTC